MIMKQSMTYLDIFKNNLVNFLNKNGLIENEVDAKKGY